VGVAVPSISLQLVDALYLRVSPCLPERGGSASLLRMRRHPRVLPDYVLCHSIPSLMLPFLSTYAAQRSLRTLALF